ncbi:retrovirus-related pol polyprotein from transposon TNT 1-94 [Tanacetum coccineum]
MVNDLEFSFQKNTCFIRNLEGVDLLSGSRDINLYTISPDDMLKTSTIYLLSKASKTKTCALGKRKKSSHQPKVEDTNQEKLYLLHIDLGGPRRMESINEKRTDNGTKFVNQTLQDFYENDGISHQTSVARTPQQNGIVERRNRTLVEAGQTMLIFSKAPLFLWPELTNHNEDLGKLNAKADIGPGLQVMTPATSRSGLVPNPIPQQPCNPPNRDDWDSLFQPMFDEYFNPSTIAISPVPVATAPRVVDIADSPVSTSIN